MWTGRLVVIVLTVMFVGLLGRVYQLQAYPEPADRRAAGLAGRHRELAAMRGGLIDRNGRVLAATRVGYRLFCDPACSSRTAPIFVPRRSRMPLATTRSEIDKKLSGRSHLRYVLLDDRMSDEQVDRFHRAQEAWTLPGDLH